jgi:pimeloyl-ACP methyl ester carboxylesterase
MKRWLGALGALIGVLVLAGTPARAEDGQQLMTIDHYVRVKSAVPAIAGQISQIYVRERVLAGPVLRGAPMADRVALFVHGAGTPAAVAFDVPHADVSWMAYLARAGFDTFAMDQTGYGRSTRPVAMDDPCNLAPAQRPAYSPGPCEPSYPFALTNIATDWAEIDAVVDHIRALRRVDKVALVAWSLGGPRAAGYAAHNPGKVSKLVLLAPAYNRAAAAGAPDQLPVAGFAFNMQSRQDLVALWNRQTGCADQWDNATLESIWSEMLASDPIGATWGPGARRAPSVTNWGWNQALVAKTMIPTLMVAGVHDVQVSPDRVRELYNDLGAEQKVFIDLGCSSHNAMWEKNRLIMFRASLEFLTAGTVNGAKSGMLKLGY